MSALMKAATGLSLLNSLISAQSQYGENQRGTIKDSDVVSQAFPPFEGVELLSPAFGNPEASPPGWSTARMARRLTLIWVCGIPTSQSAGT